MTAAQQDIGFFGHPRGLATLFFTEMWERFSYYGMRALLILFMVAPVESGGLGFDKAKAGAVYGLYTGMVYLMSLPGGWIADRILGARFAVFYGGILIACGHIFLALPAVNTFYFGLVLIVLGTGLLKPNVSALVGSLYEANDKRRDAGFSVFYMGINLGATIAPIVCGYVGQKINWHWGFGLAAIGMIAGLIQFWTGSKTFPVAAPSSAESRAALSKYGGMVAAVVVVVAGLHLSGLIEITAIGLSDAFGLALLLTVIVSFAGLLILGDWTPEERKRLWVVLILFLAACVFWSSFEQAGSTLTLFAEEQTLNEMFGFAFPSSWFQVVQPGCLIIFAPVLAWLWVRLDDKQPTTPMKFVLGLLAVGSSFLLVAMGAATITGATKASAFWLIGCYFLHAIGELCLSPVGLSAMTKLAPRNLVGLMMGLWFMSISVGNYTGGRLAGLYAGMSIVTLFTMVGIVGIAVGILLALSARPIVKLAGGIR